MDLKITTLGGKDAGKVKLSEEIFGLEPREDILQRVVRWQLAKKQQGTHQAKGRADIARTGLSMRSSTTMPGFVRRNAARWLGNRLYASVSEEVTRKRPERRWSEPAMSRSSASVSSSMRSAVAAIRSPVTVA